MDPPSNELLEMVLMVMESAWQAKDYTASQRAGLLALTLDPENVRALTRLGRIALTRREYDAAVDYFHAASMAGSSDASIAVNLAIAHSALKQFAGALLWCQLAISADPRFLPAYIHRAAILEETGDLTGAEREVTAALDLFPGNPELLYALSLYQLKRGDFEQGWRNHEQRPPRLELARKLDEYPEWQGEPLADKTILVCGEQGMGDQIQFARYLPLLEGLGARVVLFTMPELGRLFSGLAPRILTSDAELKGLEPDYWIAMGSLPLRWRQFEAVDVVATPTAAALSLPYLWPARADVERFAHLVASDGRLKVGLCWKGSPKHRRDEYRSMAYSTLEALLEVSGVAYYSLQKGDTESGLLNLTEYCHDLADTAAAIANLDLVISVDTAMLHLAGAIGKPAWGMIYTPGDWRWGTGEYCTTPWYRSTILFRQREQFQWADVVADVAKRLKQEVAAIAPSDWRGLAGFFSKQIQTMQSTSFAEHAILTRPCRYGTMTWPSNDTYIGRALDLYGEYSESEVDLLRKVLQPGNVVVEAGANVGGLTLPIASILGKSGVVHAFEPQPLYVECLRANARSAPANCAPIVAFRAALGWHDETITMRRVEEQKVHAPGWPSTGPEFSVELTSIDAMELDACHLIKVDVDGPEHLILIGAEKTIDRFRPLVYVEYDKPEQYPDMLPWLHTKGYRLYRHAAPLFNPSNFRSNSVNVFGSIVSLMVLAIPNERKEFHPGDWGLERIAVESN